MNPFKEVLLAREKGSCFKGKTWTALKAIVLIASISSIFYPKSFLITAFLSILSVSLLASCSLYSILAGSIYLFSITIIPIDALSLLFGTEPERIASVSLYTLSTMLSMVLFVSTTSNEDLEKLIGRNKFIVYTYSSIFYFISSLTSIEDSFKGRGYEATVKKPWSYVPLLIAYIYNVLEKMERIAESIEARGAE